jgi:hypothetical protein
MSAAPNLLRIRARKIWSLSLSLMLAGVLLMGAGCASVSSEKSACATSGNVRPSVCFSYQLLDEAENVLEMDGEALFDGKPPTLDALRSGDHPELIAQLVARLGGKKAGPAETLLSALAGMEGKRLAPALLLAFDQVKTMPVAHQLNVLLMKAFRLKSAAIPFPENGGEVRYTLWLREGSYGSSHTETGALTSQTLIESFSTRSQTFWSERI